MSDKSANPYDMDSANFDADKYLQKLLKTCSLKQIMDTEDSIVRDTQSLHSEMQTLVYENYNKFISATDTIRKMKTDFKQMETEMESLAQKMNTITANSDRINSTLQDTRTQLTRLSGKHSLLKRLQFLSSLPAKLTTLIGEKNHVQAVQDYKHAQKVLQQYGNQPSFQGIQSDCSVIITDLKKHLKEDFQKAGKTAQQLTETGELLLQLEEKPSELSKEMLLFATQRLHEQLVMLQDQTDRDMIEFIDMGIEGFLNDLTLVSSSYYDMFLTKHFENEDDSFETVARNDLNLFVIKNMNDYLGLVQDRAESESGDSHILLRALDRLHRRLNAMRNMGRGIEFRKNGIELILNSANQLCNTHFKNLKDSFSDSLSSIRLTLVTSKNDNSSINLNELINTIYVSTVEKVKGVLQDLMVFLSSEWSFNIRSESKGTLCIEGIRENLLVAFLRHIASVMSSFSDVNSSCPPNLLLVLSKTCLMMDKSGVRSLLNLADELYEIESENSATLTHESELSTEMRDAAHTLLDAFVRAQGLNISQMLRKSVETRDWLNCLEPRSVRAVMKRVVEELTVIESILDGLYESGQFRTSASSDSSRKTHYSLSIQNSKQQYRSTWSNYTSSSQLDNSLVSNIHRLFSERVDVFSAVVEFSKVSIMSGIIRLSLKSLLECVRLRTFSKFGLQQIQVDVHYLQMNLWRFVSDENVIHFLLDEILGSSVLRCVEPVLMEPNAVEIICERC